MLCEKCGKYAATTHIKTVIDGVVYEKNLCSDCAKSEGMGDFTSGSLSDILASVFGESAPNLNTSSLKKCECCGSTFSDISKSGKVGCPNCYKVFKNELLPYLKRVHGSIEHVGKIPDKHIENVSENSENAEDLKKQLKELIKQENYEQAAIVRDKIKSLQDGETK